MSSRSSVLRPPAGTKNVDAIWKGLKSDLTDLAEAESAQLPKARPSLEQIDRVVT